MSCQTCAEKARLRAEAIRRLRLKQQASMQTQNPQSQKQTPRVAPSKRNRSLYEAFSSHVLNRK